MTGLATKEKVIGEFTYEVTLLPVRTGQRVIVKLLSFVGPAVGALATKAATGKDAIPDDMRLDYLFTELTSGVNEEMLDELTALFMANTVVVGKDGARAQLTGEVYDFHFVGRYDAWAKWLWFSLEANFASFFGDGSAARSALDGFRAKVASASSSQSP